MELWEFPEDYVGATVLEYIGEGTGGNRKVSPPCPINNCWANAFKQSADIMSTIMHLNDKHKWTYNQIADWLDEQGYDVFYC